MLFYVGKHFLLDKGMSYEGFLTILLTALGVMLAALAIVIAVAAIWGYQGITERAALDAKKAAERKLKAHIKSAPIKALIAAEIKRHVTEAAREVMQGRIPPQITDAEQDPDQPVADEYPKGG